MSTVVIAVARPLSERRDEILRVLEELIPIFHQEAGCELYALHDDGDSFVFVEQWASEGALADHNDGEAVRRIVNAFDGALAEPIQLLTVSPLIFGDPRLGAVVPH